MLLFSIACYSQSIEIPSDISDNYIKPLPTVSSLMNFAEVTVNEFTGVPSINESLFVTKTLSKNINFNISYSYHPKSINLFEKSSDLGTGWSLNCGGAISRNVFIRPDINNPNIPSSANRDTYYFNFMGMTGSFQIEYDSNNISPQTVFYKENDEKLKIEFIKDINSNKIDSFIIYDKFGNKYVFSSFDVNVAPFIMYTPSGVTTLGEKNKQMLEYRSSWHLTEVIDNNNNKLIDFLYDNHVKFEPVGPANLYYQIKKLKQVNIKGYSDIFINYEYHPYMDDNNNSQYHSDPFNISQIIIKDKFNNTIKKFEPNFQYIEFPIFERDNIYPETLYSKPKQRRYLKELNEFNELDELTNKTSFAYNLNFPIDKILFLDSSGFIDAKEGCFIKNLAYISGLTNDISYDNLQFALSNKETSWLGSLKAVSYQIGGGYILDFETNTFSRLLTNTISDITFGLLNDENKQVNLIHEINYNTANENFIEFSIPNHQLPGKIYYFRFENDSLNIPSGITPPENNINEVEYQLLSISTCQDYCTFPNNFSDHHLTANFYFGENCIGKSLMLSPGTYRINISPYMNLPLTGRVFIYEENYISQNLKKYVYGGGNRIKSIKKYENLEIQDLESFTVGLLIKSTEFDYMSFDDNNESSGELSFGGLGNSLYYDVPSSDYQINYKNVKTTIGNNLGYVKSEYYLPSDFFYGTGSNTNLGFNVLKNGLPTKSMVFDNNHKLLEETSIDYAFTQDSNNVNYELTQVNQYLFAPQAVISSKNILNKKYYYPNNTTTPNIVETSESFTYNPINKMISEHTVLNSNGEELKTKYFYHSGNSIYSQNRIAEIEKIETFRNSELLNTSEIEYSNNWQNNVSYLPQTIKTTKATSITEDRIKYNQYDEYGNPLEVQQEGGMLISYIWGYNKSLPVAKLENIAYSAIPAQHIQAIEAASNANNETSLLAALTALRNDPALANAMISTYTHKPLVGISTATDPKGDVQYYTYDAFNRLQFVKDKDGNIVSENEYHYRTQN